MMAETQTKMLLRVASAYRTVSAEALNVITGIPKMDLMIMERKSLNESEVKDKEAAKYKARDETMRL